MKPVLGQGMRQRFNRKAPEFKVTTTSPNKPRYNLIENYMKKPSVDADSYIDSVMVEVQDMVGELEKQKMERLQQL